MPRRKSDDDDEREDGEGMELDLNDDKTEPAAEPADKPEPDPGVSPVVDPGDPSLPGRPPQGDNANERKASSMRPAPAAWRGPIAPRSAPPVENPIGSVAMGAAMLGAGVQGFPTLGGGSGVIFSGLGQAPTAAAFAQLAP